MELEREILKVFLLAACYTMALSLLRDSVLLGSVRVGFLRGGSQRESNMSDAVAEEREILSAPHVLECDYRRSLGAVLGRFFTGLRDHRIEGVRTKQGRILVPPAEYDPFTGESTTGDFVEVGPVGVVTSWAWVSEPRPKHPLKTPFAFALIRLDGADTAMLHVVDAGDASKMSTGMRVRVKWADETKGRILDIACFVPEGTR